MGSDAVEAPVWCVPAQGARAAARSRREACRSCATEKTWIVEPLVEPWLAVERVGFAHALAAFRGDEMVAGRIGPERRWDLVDCGSLNTNFGRYGAYDVSVPEFTRRVLLSLGAPAPPAG